MKQGCLCSKCEQINSCPVPYCNRIDTSNDDICKHQWELQYVDNTKIVYRCKICCAVHTIKDYLNR